MQNTPSRTIPVIIGFFLCLTLMCVISLTGYHAVHQTTSMTIEQSRNADATVRAVQVLRQFDAALIAALCYRETNAKQYADEVMMQVKITMEEAAQLDSYLVRPEGRGRLRDLMMMYEEFAQCSAQDWEIGVKIKELEVAWRRYQTDMLNSLEKLTELQKEYKKNNPDVALADGLALIGEVRESMLHIALLRQYLASPDRQVANAARNELQQKWEQVRSVLDTIDRNVVTPAMKQAVQNTLDESAPLINLTQMWADLHDKQQDNRLQQNAIADDTAKLGEEWLALQDERLHIHEAEMHRFVRMMSAMLGVCSFVAITMGIIIGLVVVVLVNCKSSTPAYSATYSEGFTSPEPPSNGADLRIVADRLQEVVNLLRK